MTEPSPSPSLSSSLSLTVDTGEEAMTATRLAAKVLLPGASSSPSSVLPAVATSSSSPSTSSPSSSPNGSAMGMNQIGKMCKLPRSPEKASGGGAARGGYYTPFKYMVHSGKK
jgi:hypothetical protein